MTRDYGVPELLVYHLALILEVVVVVLLVWPHVELTHRVLHPLPKLPCFPGALSCEYILFQVLIL